MLVLTADMPRWVQVEKAEKGLPPIDYHTQVKVPVRLIPTDKHYKKYYEMGVLKASEFLFVFEVQQPYKKKQWVFTGIEDKE